MLDGVGSLRINYRFGCKLAILINITSVIIFCNWMIKRHSTHLSLLYWCQIEFVINCGFLSVLTINTHTHTLHWAYYSSPLIDRNLLVYIVVVFLPQHHSGHLFCLYHHHNTIRWNILKIHESSNIHRPHCKTFTLTN